MMKIYQMEDLKKVFELVGSKEQNNRKLQVSNALKIAVNYAYDNYKDTVVLREKLSDIFIMADTSMALYNRNAPVNPEELTFGKDYIIHRLDSLIESRLIVNMIYSDDILWKLANKFPKAYVGASSEVQKYMGMKRSEYAIREISNDDGNLIRHRLHINAAKYNRNPLERFLPKFLSSWIYDFGKNPEFDQIWFNIRYRFKVRTVENVKYIMCKSKLIYHNKSCSSEDVFKANITLDYTPISAFNKNKFPRFSYGKREHLEYEKWMIRKIMWLKFIETLESHNESSSFLPGIDPEFDLEGYTSMKNRWYRVFMMDDFYSFHNRPSLTKLNLGR